MSASFKPFQLCDPLVFIAVMSTDVSLFIGVWPGNLLMAGSLKNLQRQPLFKIINNSSARGGASRELSFNHGGMLIF